MADPKIKPADKPQAKQPVPAAVLSHAQTVKRGPGRPKTTSQNQNEGGTHSFGGLKPAEFSGQEAREAALVALFGLEHLSPEVLGLVRHGLPAVLDGLVRGAANPGVQGNADRVTLFKLLGADWAQPQHRALAMAAGGKAGAGELGDRIGRAVGRVEKHLVGHAAVTVEDADRSKLAAILAPQRDGHMIVDHGRYHAGGATVDMAGLRASLAAALAVGDSRPGDEGPVEDAGDEGALTFDG